MTERRMLRYEQKTASFRLKEVDNYSPRRSGVPINPRDKSPHRNPPSSATPLDISQENLSPRRINSMHSIDSPVVKEALTDNSARKFERDSVIYIGKRVKNSPTRNIAGIFQDPAASAQDFSKQREVELGRYSRKQVEVDPRIVNRRAKEGLLPRSTRKEPPSPTFHLTRPESDVPITHVPKASGKARSVSPRQDHIVIGVDPDQHVKSTPIYSTNTKPTLRVVVLPASSERHVDDKGNTTYQNPTWDHPVSPSGRKHSEKEKKADTARVIRHKEDPGPEEKIGRKKGPSFPGSAILGTTARDATKVQSLHILEGPPPFVLEPKPKCSYRIHTKPVPKPENHDILNRNTNPPPVPSVSPRRSPSRRADHDIFGTYVNRPDSPVRASGRRVAERSPVRSPSNIVPGIN